MTDTDSAVGQRMAGGYEPPILTEPDGGPLPDQGKPDVQAAVADGDAQRIQQQWQAARDRLLKRWPKLAKPMVDELAAQAETAAAAGDVARLGELAVSAGVIAAIATPLQGSGSELAKLAAAGVVQEAAGQGVHVAAPGLPGDVLVKQTASAYARIIASGYASGASRAALQLAGADPGEVRDAVAQHLADLGDSTNGLVGDNVGALLSAAQHAGRLAVLEQQPGNAVEAVETNDVHRCQPCSDAAGHRYPDLPSALKDYPIAGNKACLGRSRCRGHLRMIWR